MDELVFHEATEFGPCWARKLVQATFVKEEWMALLANVHTELHVEAATLLVQATFVKEGWMVLLVANVHTELRVEAAKFDLKRKF